MAKYQYASTLVVSKKFDTKEKISRFYKHNYLPLLMTCEIWIIVYNLFNAFLGLQPLQVDLMLKNMFFSEHINMMNAWYIPMILGVYIFIPYVARILQSLSGKSLIILGLILFSYYFIVPSCNLLLALEKLPRLSPQIDLNYSGGTYGFYLLLGYSYKRYEDRIVSVLKNNKKKILVVLSILLMAACTVLFQNRLYQNHAAYNVWYDFCFCLLLASAALCYSVRSRSIIKFFIIYPYIRSLFI